MIGQKGERETLQGKHNQLTFANFISVILMYNIHFRDAFFHYISKKIINRWKQELDTYLCPIHHVQ